MILREYARQAHTVSKGKMRREKIKSEFNAHGPQAKAGPRQHYGMDFYGLIKGEILVIVDLFTRETILQWLPKAWKNKSNLVTK